MLGSGVAAHGQWDGWEGHSRTPGIAAIVVSANPQVDTIAWSLTEGRCRYSAMWTDMIAEKLIATYCSCEGCAVNLRVLVACPLMTDLGQGKPQAPLVQK